jgi:hypothetical protein
MAIVIHYGLDHCHRIPLLSGAGFDVTDCASLPALQRLLEQSPIDAILVTEFPSDELIHAARRLSTAPLVWFPPDPSTISDDRFDLVIPPLTSPEEWIASVRALLAESRKFHAQSATFRADSGLFRAAAVRQEKQSWIRRLKDARRPRS